MTRAIIGLYVLLAVFGGVIGYVAFDARSDVGGATERIRILETSPCNEAPRGRRCQAILTAALCKLQPRLLSGCDRLPNTQPNESSPTEGGRNDGPSTPATGTAPSEGAAVGPSPDGGSAPADDGGGGSAGDGGGGTPPQPPPDPPQPPSPPAPTPTPPESPSGVAGTGIDPQLPVLGGTCDLAPVLCP